MASHFGDERSPGGFDMGEVVSALQKAIRRGEEERALFWATELELSGYGSHCWNRLLVIASEDVGVADPTAVLTVHSLRGAWLERKKKEDADKRRTGRRTPESRLYLLHAVMTLARAKKWRGVDHVYMWLYEGDRTLLGMEIPDEALDGHTARGRRMGRRAQFFLEESSKLENEPSGLDDPYRERGHRNHLSSGGGRVKDYDPYKQWPPRAGQQSLEVSE